MKNDKCGSHYYYYYYGYIPLPGRNLHRTIDVVTMKPDSIVRILEALFSIPFQSLAPKDVAVEIRQPFRVI
jgi:hypothetical protein